MIVKPASPAIPLQDTQLSLKAVFQCIDAHSCPHFFNFHMHTVHSDGQLQPEGLIQQAVTIGLRGLAITDHHTIGGYQAARQWLENWNLNQHGQATRLKPTLWTGVEINAGLLGIEVHVLGYAFDPDHSSIQPYLQTHPAAGDAYQARQVIASIHQAGGLAVLAHPARYGQSPADLISEIAKLGIDGVETYYCYGNHKPWQPSPKQTTLVRNLGESYGLLHTCGTDTHGINLLQRL